MYNPQLTTFISVAENGSFTKAADDLYMTPTAVMKQINVLEERLGTTLFDRTNRGLQLTEAGKSFLQDARYIIDYSDRAIQKAKEIDGEDKQQSIRIGTSIMTPAQAEHGGHSVYGTYRLQQKRRAGDLCVRGRERRHSELSHYENAHRQPGGYGCPHGMSLVSGHGVRLRTRYRHGSRGLVRPSRSLLEKEQLEPCHTRHKRNAPNLISRTRLMRFGASMTDLHCVTA